MTKAEVARRRLAAYFARNGYVRRKNPERAEADGQSYKKGYEIRLVAADEAELEEIGRLLLEAGFKAGRPYAKARRWALPIYGKRAVERFMALVEHPERPEGVIPSVEREESLE